MPLPNKKDPASNEKIFEITAPATPILSNHGSVSDKNEKTKDTVSAFDETLPTPNLTTPKNASGQEFFSAQPRTSQEGGESPTYTSKDAVQLQNGSE